MLCDPSCPNRHYVRANSIINTQQRSSMFIENLSKMIMGYRAGESWEDFELSKLDPSDPRVLIFDRGMQAARSHGPGVDDD